MLRSTPLLALLLSCSFAISSSASNLESAPRSFFDEPAGIIGERDGAPLYAKTVVSRVYTIDAIFRSMEGPSGMDKASLWDEPGPPELLWVTGYRAEMVGPDADETTSPEFMCHSTMNITDDTAYQKRFPSRLGLLANRLFTLDQGSTLVDLPSGFGVPVMSDQVMLFNSQVLNHNLRTAPFDVRQKIYIEFVRDRDLEKPLIPLLQHGAWVSVLVDGRDGHYGLKEGETAEGPGCSMGDNNGLAEYVVDDGEGAEVLGVLGREARAPYVSHACHDAAGSAVRHDDPLRNRASAPVRRVARTPRSHE